MGPSYLYRAELVRIVDGDTIYFNIDLGFGVWLRKQSIRLSGVDTPEIRGEEREQGLISKKFVEDVLNSCTDILLETTSAKGKYGRWIADVWYGTDGHWIMLNNQLLEEGLAEPY